MKFQYSSLKEYSDVILVLKNEMKQLKLHQISIIVNEITHDLNLTDLAIFRLDGRVILKELYNSIACLFDNTEDDFKCFTANKVFLFKELVAAGYMKEVFYWPPLTVPIGINEPGSKTFIVERTFQTKLGDASNFSEESKWPKTIFGEVVTFQEFSKFASLKYAATDKLIELINKVKSSKLEE